ncbi:MAG: hypothetical protein ACTSUE_11795 [Promethearchaeota archaeon]
MDKLERMISKLRLEHEHFRRLKERGMSSLSISDGLIHFLLDVLEKGFRNRYPRESEAMLNERMRKHVLSLDKAKKQEMMLNGRID